MDPEFYPAYYDLDAIERLMEREAMRERLDAQP